MINKVQDGKRIDVVFATNTLPGDVIDMGDMIVVAVSGGGVGVTGSCEFTGVFNLPKGTAAGSGMPQGMKVYWDSSAKHIVKANPTDGFTPAGWVWKTATDSDTTVHVRLLG